MLKRRNMSVSGLCPDIPLIKRGKKVLNKGPESQHLNLAFTGFFMGSHFASPSDVDLH